MGPGSLPRNGEGSKETRRNVTHAELLDLPRSLADRLRSLSPAVADATLARFVAETSRAYTRARDRLDDAASDSARIARARFFLPRDLPKAMAVFRDLDRRGRLPRRERLRTLDLGAGLGTTTLSLARYVSLADAARMLDVTAIDVDGAALATMARIALGLEGFAPIELTTKGRDLRRVATNPGGTYDVITIGLALNELADDAEARADVLGSLVAALADDGVLVVVEPALRDTTRELMRVRDLVEERRLATIEGPCAGAARCPLLANDRDWCHAELPGALAPEIGAIAKLAGLRADDPTFAWLALSRPTREHERRTKRTLRVVSAPLGSKGKTEIHTCGDAGLVRLVELDRDAKARPVPASEWRRGALITIDATEPKSGFERIGVETTVDLVVD